MLSLAAKRRAADLIEVERHHRARVDRQQREPAVERARGSLGAAAGAATRRQRSDERNQNHPVGLHASPNADGETSNRRAVRAIVLRHVLGQDAISRSRRLGARRRRRAAGAGRLGPRRDEVPRDRREELSAVGGQPHADRRRRGRAARPGRAGASRGAARVEDAGAARRRAGRVRRLDRRRLLGQPRADGHRRGRAARRPAQGAGRVPGRRHQQHRRADRDRARARPGRRDDEGERRQGRRAGACSACASTATPATRSACWKRAGRRRPTRSWSARVRKRVAAVPNLEFVKVPGHAGVPENERCDELARTAILRGR